MPRTVQLNLRLLPEHLSVLETQAYLEGESVAEIARRVIEAHVADLRDRAEVRQALEARARYRGIAEGSVRALEDPGATT